MQISENVMAVILLIGALLTAFIIYDVFFSGHDFPGYLSDCKVYEDGSQYCWNPDTESNCWLSADGKTYNCHKGD